MKTTILFIFACLVSTHCFSQLTKSETIAYLNSRLAETRGLLTYFDQKTKFTISNTSVEASTKYKGKITFSFDRKFTDGTSDRLVRTFDPTHIATITPGNVIANDAVGFLNITLIGPTFISWQKTVGLAETYAQSDKFTFPFLIAEPLNVERVQKALLHLKKLYVESKPRDPFVN